MAIQWSEAQIATIVESVLRQIKNEDGQNTARKTWDASSYCGRQLIGVYADMNDAIRAAEGGYRAVRAMSVADRKSVV